MNTDKLGRLVKNSWGVRRRKVPTPKKGSSETAFIKPRLHRKKIVDQMLWRQLYYQVNCWYYTDDDNPFGSRDNKRMSLNDAKNWRRSIADVMNRLVYPERYSWQSMQGTVEQGLEECAFDFVGFFALWQIESQRRPDLPVSYLSTITTILFCELVFSNRLKATALYQKMIDIFLEDESVDWRSMSSSALAELLKQSSPAALFNVVVSHETRLEMAKHLFFRRKYLVENYGDHHDNRNMVLKKYISYLDDLPEVQERLRAELLSFELLGK